MDAPPTSDEAARLLSALAEGREGAAEELLPLLYDELRDLARRHMLGERAGHTLQTTALVHEAYLRLRGGLPAGGDGKADFMRLAARAMRRVLIDHARRRDADHRAGARTREPLDIALETLEEVSDDLPAVDRELTALAEVDERMAQVVELRFFGGLTVPETAEVLGVSPGTVKNEWALAKAWLKQRLG